MENKTQQFISEKHTYISLVLMTTILGFVAYSAINLGIYKEKIDNMSIIIQNHEQRLKTVENFLSKDSSFYKEIMAK